MDKYNLNGFQPCISWPVRNHANSGILHATCNKYTTVLPCIPGGAVPIISDFFPIPGSTRGLLDNFRYLDHARKHGGPRVRALLITTDYPPDIGGLQTYSCRIARGLPGGMLDVRSGGKRSPSPRIARPGPGVALAWRAAVRAGAPSGGACGACPGSAAPPRRFLLHMQWTTAIPSMLLRMAVAQHALPGAGPRRRTGRSGTLAGGPAQGRRALARGRGGGGVPAHRRNRHPARASAAVAWKSSPTAIPWKEGRRPARAKGSAPRLRTGPPAPARCACTAWCRAKAPPCCSTPSPASRTAAGPGHHRPRRRGRPPEGANHPAQAPRPGPHPAARRRGR